MKFVFTLVSLLITMGSLANPLDSIRAERRAEGLFIVHEVEEEETIYSIAKRYGGSVIGIIKHNQIINNLEHKTLSYPSRSRHNKSQRFKPKPKPQNYGPAFPLILLTSNYSSG